MIKNNKNIGFTIVELLIVIVIIGILAALALNFFANAQRDARNAYVINAAKAYRSSLTRYAIENGGYPAGTPGARIGITANGVTGQSECLGLGYPNVMPSGDPACIEITWNGNSFDHATILEENEVFMDTLKPYVSPELLRLSRNNAPSICYAGECYKNYTLIYETTPNIVINNDQNQNSYIIFNLEGLNEDCRLPVIRQSSVSGGKVYFTTSPDKYSYSAPASLSTECYVPLPRV